jgi:predicted permease
MLVVAELTLAAVLLVGAGVLLESFRAIARVDPGFRPEGVLTYRISLRGQSYEEGEDRRAFYERHMERVRSFPGVLAAGAVSTTPLGSHEGWFFEAEGAAPREPDAPTPVALLRVATPGYFEALGITLHAGRFFNESDGRDPAAGVAIVNEEFKELFWPGMEAMGRRIRAGGDENPWHTVVGIVRDVKHYGLQTEMRPGVYLPYRASMRREMTMVLRAATDPEALAPLAREAVRELDPTLPIFDVVSISRRLQESLWIRRTSSWLVTVFAAFALALAVAGIYGVISHAANERTREIAIRMALGATRSQVLASVLKQGGILIAVGITLGTVSALAAGRLLSSFLFQVSATDLRVYALVIGILVVSGFLANWLPARRACAIDPMDSLRAD